TAPSRNSFLNFLRFSGMTLPHRSCLHGNGGYPPFMFVFDAQPVDLQAIHLQEEELSDWEFVHQTELEEFVADRMARRLRAALEAKQTEQTLYLEDGRRVQPDPGGDSVQDRTH
ncbi:MAG: NUDIX hydrolase, partial [Acidimicrobiales bacterium]